ncbi:MAG: MFS transporter [Chloroflexi bacterium]|nr:MFS transporter [Chloroflexota bacterium]
MNDSRPGFRQAFESLAYADYRRFAVALLLTQMGAQIVQIAILWQVYQLTGSPLLLGLTGLARAIPHIVLSLIGGVIADRVNRIRLIQVGQVTNAALTLALAALTIAGWVEVWHLYVATSLNAAFTALTQPARTALIPRLVPPRTLVNAVALNATIQQIAQIVGPALAGGMIGAADLGPTYLVNGAAYLLGVVALAGIRTPALSPATEESPWQSLLEGLEFVRDRPVIVSLLGLDLSQTIFGGYRVLLPLIADQVLGVGPEGYGLLSAAPGVGSVLGATAILSLGDMRYKGIYTICGVLGNCVALVLLAVSPWFVLSLVASALLGVTNSVQMVPRNSAILAITPDALRGRVESFRSMLAGGGPPLGYTLAGAVAAALGAPMALALGAAACAVTVLGIAVTRHELRDPNLGSFSPEPVGVE